MHVFGPFSRNLIVFGISPDGDAFGCHDPGWFALADKKEATRAIVWQVADRSFDGTNPQVRAPAGLIEQGNIAVQDEGFSIDFAAIAERSEKLKVQALQTSR